MAQLPDFCLLYQYVPKSEYCQTDGVHSSLTWFRRSQTAIYASGAGLGASKGKEISKFASDYAGYVNLAKDGVSTYPVYPPHLALKGCSRLASVMAVETSPCALTYVIVGQPSLKL